MVVGYSPVGLVFLGPPAGQASALGAADFPAVGNPPGFKVQIMGRNAFRPMICTLFLQILGRNAFRPTSYETPLVTRLELL